MDPVFNNAYGSSVQPLPMDQVFNTAYGSSVQQCIWIQCSTMHVDPVFNTAYGSSVQHCMWIKCSTTADGSSVQHCRWIQCSTIQLVLRESQGRRNSARILCAGPRGPRPAVGFISVCHSVRRLASGRGYSYDTNSQCKTLAGEINFN
ncbi:hypothetical protein Btru_016759 [Bulinus truncatus]|nr:hypothetical protein Btru_016759 [Bulinus truncatus]